MNHQKAPESEHQDRDPEFGHQNRDSKIQIPNFIVGIKMFISHKLGPPVTQCVWSVNSLVGSLVSKQFGQFGASKTTLKSFSKMN